MARWVNLISEFNIKIMFLPSTCNASDQLSRTEDMNNKEGVPMARNIFKDFGIYNSYELLL